MRNKKPDVNYRLDNNPFPMKRGKPGIEVYQFTDDLQNALLCPINAVLRALQDDLVALDANAREADDDAAEFV